MQLEAERRGDVLVVRVHAPRIDAASAIQFKDAMRERVSGAGGRVILDLTEVAMIDSSGLGAVVAVMKMLGPGRRLGLAGLTPVVDSVFRLTRMDTVIAIYPGVDQALATPAPV